MEEDEDEATDVNEYNLSSLRLREERRGAKEEEEDLCERTRRLRQSDASRTDRRLIIAFGLDVNTRIKFRINDD